MWGQLQPAEPWSQSYEAKPASAQSLVRRPAKIVNIQRVTSPKYTKYNGTHPLVHGYAPVKYDVDRMNGSWDMRITVRQILLALQIHWAPASSCKIMYNFSWKTASCLHLRLLSSQHGRKQTTSNSFQDCETIVCTANDHNWRVVFFGFYLISHILLFIMVLTCIFFFLPVTCFQMKSDIITDATFLPALHLILCKLNNTEHSWPSPFHCPDMLACMREPPSHCKIEQPSISQTWIPN